MMTTTPTATAVTVDTTAFTVTVRAVTAIEASAEATWAVLSDTGSYPEWNPFVRRFDGELTVGAKVDVELQLEGRKAQTMSPTIMDVEPGRTFEWLGGFGFRGVLDGRHRFEIEPIDADGCRLIQSEKLSGALVPIFRRLLTGPTPSAFVASNEALRARVEDAG